MGAKEKNFYVETAERFGHGDSAREVQRLFAAGDRTGAAQALTPELIEGSAICCDYGELDERLAAYERAGADTLLALPFGDRPRIIEALGAAVVACLGPLRPPSRPLQLRLDGLLLVRRRSAASPGRGSRPRGRRPP